VVGRYASLPDGGGLDYAKLFSVPMWIAVGCLVALLVLYREPKRAG
jgi:hypothetical protein